MTKTELVSNIAEEAGITKALAEKCLDALTAAVAKELIAGEKVTLPGLGIFSVTERSARTGRNPQTGEPIEIAAGRSVKFKIAKGIKDSL